MRLFMSNAIVREDAATFHSSYRSDEPSAGRFNLLSRLLHLSHSALHSNVAQLEL